MKCFEQFHLYITPKQFLFVPPRGQGADPAHPGLLMSRVTSAISLCDDPHGLAHSMTHHEGGDGGGAKGGDGGGGVKKMTIFGVLGVARAPNRGGGYLVVLRRKARVGVLRGRYGVWRHDGVEVIAIRPRSRKDGGDTHPDDELIRSFIVQVLSTPYFYFSYDYDLTHTAQRLFTLGDEKFFEVITLHENL